MRPCPPRWPSAVLYAAVVLFLFLVGLSLRLFRLADDGRAEARRLSTLFESTRDDRLLLSRYEAARDRLSSLPPMAPGRLLPASLAEPDGKGERLLEPVDGLQGKVADWSWKRLDKREAFELLAALQSPSNEWWRVSGMEMEALPDGESVSLRLRLVTARPVDGSLPGR